MKLTGSDDLDKVVWGENNDVTVSNPEEVLQLITHSYIEGRGAETTVKLEVPSVDNPDKVEMVKVKRSVITVGGGRDSKHSKQEALHVVNGTGEIEHAHLAFREHTGSGTPERELLHLEDSNGIAVKEVVFYSEEKSKREKDWVFDLVKKQASEVKVSVLVNSGTDKANKLRSRDDSVTEVTGDVDENYQSDELLPLPTMDDFFKKGADAGNQLADRFVLQNILKAQEGANATNISSYYQKKWLVDDSGIVFKSNSDSETLCFRVETVILSGWIAFGIENIAILG
ncbi:MAG: hypothetical protein ACPG5T_10310, partial [Endozoicomonas sp.]